jgi:molecular chaperone GrpE
MQAIAAVVEKVLPVLDNFERAAMSLKTSTSQEALIQEQYTAVQAQLVEILAQYGVKEMECEGKPFDPMLHEAIMQDYNDQVHCNG